MFIPLKKIFNITISKYKFLLATDILMHMITLLNDKKDWRIRATFFESCPIVAKHLGQNRCRKLKPFLQQVIFLIFFK